MMFNKTYDIAPFGGGDEIIVVCEKLHRRLGHKDVKSVLDCIHAYGVVNI
jgi:hypothetical protein